MGSDQPVRGFEHEATAVPEALDELDSARDALERLGGAVHAGDREEIVKHAKRAALYLDAALEAVDYCAESCAPDYGE